MNSDTLKVSIIIPNYNRSAYLNEALSSVKRQSYSNWECIVVDDGSTDNSINVIRSFSDHDSRIRIVYNQSPSKGACSARNKGISLSKGEYIIFLDSDDLLSPHCLEQRVDVMKANHDLDFAVFPMLLFYNKPGDSNLLWNNTNCEDDLWRFLKLDSVWQTSGPIWRKEALLSFPLFDERLTCWQDVSFHINILLLTRNYRKFYSLPPDCYYRKNSSESISQQSLVKKAHLVSRWTLINDLQKKLNCINNKMYSTKYMFLNFYFSYIKFTNLLNLHKYIKIIFSYIVFYKKEYKPTTSEQLILFCLTLLNISRFIRISFIKKFYTNHIKEILPASSIGIYKYEI